MLRSVKYIGEHQEDYSDSKYIIVNTAVKTNGFQDRESINNFFVVFKEKAAKNKRSEEQTASTL